MIGWTSPTSLAERVTEIAIGFLMALFAAGAVVWVAGEVAGFLSHGAWPPMGLADAPGVAGSLVQHPGDPAAGWPAAARPVAPPTWLFYLLLVALIVLISGIGLAVATWLLGRCGEYRGLGRVRRDLRYGPGIERRQQPFLGWSGTGPLTRLVFGTTEDCVAVIGPPRSGKTQGVLIPQVLVWEGPLVSASTWPDVLDATAANRHALAAQQAGRVMLWAPTSTGHRMHGVEVVGWSPLDGCADAETCERRVRALVGTSAAGVGARHADHWRDNAIRVLRGYFHAAARDGIGIRGMLAWLARNELKEPSIILARAETAAGEMWAAELEGMGRVPTDELGSIFSAARTALGALQNGRVLASCEAASPFDVEAFLRSPSTLYVVSPTADQDLIAPLAASLVEHLVQRAYDLWELGRLPARLLLALDELVNIAPLPSLLKILTQGAGRGVNLVWAVQSLAQFRDRYGEQVADAAFSSSRARLVFGGLTDTRDLQAISQLAGEHEVPARSFTRTGMPGQHSMTAATTWRPRLPVSAIRGIPAGQAVLLYHSNDPALVRVRLAHGTPLWRRAAQPPAVVIRDEKVYDRPRRGAP
jgi:type IV secretory pathway TraG/TraD family ATPase VirD4